MMRGKQDRRRPLSHAGGPCRAIEIVVVVTTNSARPNEISRATRGRRAIRQNTDEAGILTRQCRDRKAVRRFLAARLHETIGGPTKPFCQRTKIA
jgi:hypothetical protein